MDNSNGQPVLESLTDRELEILRLIDEGLSNREIAQELVVTLGTVKWYNKQIYSKLGVHSRTQAVAYAREARLFETEATPPRPAIIPKHNLPAQVTSFVGREQEIAEVKHLLTTTRLLTLTGPPGTGKTRLGLHIAAQVLEQFEDGVFFVDLAPISDPQLVVSTITQVLDVKDLGGQPLSDTLKSHLRGKRLLLLLDNYEQVIEAAPLVGDLLSASPGLKAMVTSREVLHVYGEQEYPVPPLALPDLDRIAPLDLLSQYEAVELFVQRARAVKPDFAITAENAPAVAEICVRLDGLPLAIELAAARVRLLTPLDLSARLENRFTVLMGGMRDLPLRHQMLHTTIDWSYDLLDEDERMLFARLAVFQGGRTVESAEAVCGSALSIEVLDGLESLLTKSLLFQEEHEGGELRFYMLETIQAYARERLEESGEAEELRRRHAEYFVALAEQAEPELRGGRQGYWIVRLRAERHNLRTALAWSLAGANVELGLRLAGALRDFWYYEGHIGEGLRWTGKALESARDAPSAIRAKVLNAAGWLSFAQGDYEQGKVWNDQALALYRELGDRTNSAWALVFRSAHSLGFPDEYKEGIALVEEGLKLFRELDDKPGMTQALNNLGELIRMDGDYERAGRAYEECLAISHKIGDRQREAIMLGNLGYVAQHQGDYERAETLTRQFLTLWREFGSRYFIAAGLAGLAGPVSARGDPERAARLLGASEVLFETIGVDLQCADQFEADRYEAAVREQLDKATFEARWAEGRAMSLEKAVAYALGEAATTIP
jgi:non-specific serine/threonine protein kinase